MSAYEDMVEAARNELHQHGDLAYLLNPKQTDRWQDCPRSDAHDGAGRAVVDAVLAALPPSIVVDGKVVGLDDERLLAEIREEFGDHGVAAVMWLPQAVLGMREVAE